MVLAEKEIKGHYRSPYARWKKELTPEDMLRIEHQGLLLNAFERATAYITSSEPDMKLACRINDFIPKELLEDSIPLDHLVTPIKKQKTKREDKYQNDDPDLARIRGKLKMFWNRRINYVTTNSRIKVKSLDDYTLGDLREAKRNGYKDIPFAAVTPDSLDFILFALAEK